MDGLVSNVGLIAGIAAAGAAPSVIMLTGISGLLAGGISMGLGEYASVRTQNEQYDSEVHTERAALKRNPEGEQAELAEMFVSLGMQSATATEAASQVHEDHEQALRVHLAHELGLTADTRPSPVIVAISSLLAFSIGALVPLLPFFFGASSLWLVFAFGGAGLLIAGSFAAIFSGKNPFFGAIRQLTFGTIAVIVTFTVGSLLGVSEYS